MTDNPRTPVGELLHCYEIGELSLAALIEAFRNYRFPDPVWKPKPDPFEAMLDDPSPYEPGTWEEVSRARDTGILSFDAYMQISEAVTQGRRRGVRSNTSHI